MLFVLQNGVSEGNNSAYYVEKKTAGCLISSKSIRKAYKSFLMLTAVVYVKPYNTSTAKIYYERKEKSHGKCTDRYRNHCRSRRWIDLNCYQYRFCMRRNAMNFEEFIKPEFLILIPVLYLVGIGLKKSKLSDTLIPLALGVISITLSATWVIATSNIDTLRDVALAFFVSVTQGVLSAGASVYINQLYVQSKKKD